MLTMQHGCNLTQCSSLKQQFEATHKVDAILPKSPKMIVKTHSTLNKLRQFLNLCSNES